MITLLIIEDDPLIMRMYQQAFNFDKHRALVADNGEDGLAKAKAKKPDVILLDIMLPKMNGLQVLKKLKLDPDTKNIPVIMLTNVGKEESIKAALSMGAVKYITKVDNTPKQVLSQVEEILVATTRNRIPETD